RRAWLPQATAVDSPLQSRTSFTASGRPSCDPKPAYPGLRLGRAAAEFLGADGQLLRHQLLRRGGAIAGGLIRGGQSGLCPVEHLLLLLEHVAQPTQGVIGRSNALLGAVHRVLNLSGG